MSNPKQLDGTDVSDNYALRKSELERERLDGQHRYITELLGGRLIVDKSVKIRPQDRVLDAGTGTASWLCSLLKEVPNSVELVGNDISGALFPNELPSNMKLYEMSTLSLPSEWDASFDFINNRLLGIVFTVPQWQTALAELFRVLKPGGAIQFMEWGHFGTLQDESALPVLTRAVDMIYAVMDRRGLLGIRCGTKLPELLEEAGFSDIQVEICKAPLGEKWGELGMTGSKNLEALLRGCGASLVAEGGLGVWESQAEVDMRIDDAKKAWSGSEGIYFSLYVITAKKAS